MEDLKELKIVTFDVALYLKNIGFPQKRNKTFYVSESFNSFKKGNLYEACNIDIAQNIPFIYAPTYIEVWLWLWRNKIVELIFDYGAKINDVDEILYCFPSTYHDNSHPKMKYLIQTINRFNNGQCCSHEYAHEHADPEESIINTINYLVENKLIYIN